MALIDEKGRLFGKINIIDLALLLLLLAAVGFVGAKALGTNSLNMDEGVVADKQVEVTVFIEKVRPESAEVMNNTEAVYFNESSAKLEVTNVKVTPTEIVGYDSEGQAVKTEDPISKSVFMTIKGEGYFDEETEEYFLADKKVMIGSKADLRANFLVSGFIIDIKAD